MKTETNLIFVLTKDGKYIFSDKDVNQCWFKLQRIQGQSADWACRYEGYKVTEMTTKEAINLLKERSVK